MKPLCNVPISSFSVCVLAIQSIDFCSPISFPRNQKRQRQWFPSDERRQGCRIRRRPIEVRLRSENRIESPVISMCESLMVYLPVWERIPFLCLPRSVYLRGSPR